VHGRFFSDRKHSEQYGHSDAGHFMLANFHTDSFFHGSRTESLEQTRRRVLRIAERGWGTHYCSDFNYGPEHHLALERYAGYDYDKVIGRISFRHKDRSYAC